MNWYALILLHFSHTLIMLQNMAKPPPSLPPTTTNPLAVSLIIGSFENTGLQAYIFDLVVPPSQPAPVHPDEARFHLLPEIEHTFRPDQKMPPKYISFVASLITLSPWVVLIGLVRPLTFSSLIQAYPP